VTRYNSALLGSFKSPTLNVVPKKQLQLSSAQLGLQRDFKVFVLQYIMVGKKKVMKLLQNYGYFFMTPNVYGNLIGLKYLTPSML
jgi:hypothetical protein